ncbi:MAG: hypothetical protein P8J87_08920, partial [Verrucomicrobiales bacterium]|nr:hypothetical protein [Verrucomicrobiales bacterium]
ALSLLQELTVQESTLKGQLQVVEREVTQMGSKLEGVQWEQGELFKRLESAETLIESLISREAEAKKDLEKRLTETRSREAELAEATRHEAEVNNLLNELRTSLAVERRAAQALQQQKEPMANRLKELEELIARRDSDIASYKEKIELAKSDSETLRAGIGAAKAEADSLTETLTELNGERTEQDEALSATEQTLLANRRELNGIGEQRGNEEIKATQIDLRIENLADTVRERYNIELESFEIDTHALLVAIDLQKKSQSSLEKRRATRAARENSDDPNQPPSNADEEAEAEADAKAAALAAETEVTIPEDGPDWEFVESVVGDLKRKLDSMGPVNLDAIEEFEELEERHNFLQTQHDDLVNSKEELLRIIEQINRETRKMFAETFYKVRENFQSTFKELFGQGATADLILVDENDPLESGIDIIARPPGKKPTSITLLSGGERSMTAVALLFSIYMVKPSPFCVLDELDAPLDESNIGRFLKMLDRFIDQSQFVIVTHNKRTMNRADILYGVTQQEFGVSKLVGMQLTKNQTENKPLRKRSKARTKA